MATCRACRKCKKSKIAGLGCLRVATVAISNHPPKKSSCGGWPEGPNLNFEKNALVHFLVTKIPPQGKLRNGLKMMVSGRKHLLGRVKTSDLVQSGRGHLPRCCGANMGPKVINHDDIALGRPENTHLGIWRPLGEVPPPPICEFALAFLRAWRTLRN